MPEWLVVHGRGLAEEELATLTLEAFRQHPFPSFYAKVVERLGPEVAAREIRRMVESGHDHQAVSLLLDARQLDDALALLEAAPDACFHQLMELADELVEREPDTAHRLFAAAAEQAARLAQPKFYCYAVQSLSKGRESFGDTFDGAVAAFKKAHAKKRKLIAELSAAGL